MAARSSAPSRLSASTELPHIRVALGTGLEHVRLVPTKVRKAANTGGRGRKWRWYREYQVPDDARVPRKFRNGTIRTRLDTTDEDRRRGINRAEYLRGFAVGHDHWSVVGGPRSRAESLFSKTKHRWVNRRIPAIGVAHGTVRLLGFAIALNAEAAHHYEQRTGHRIGRPPDPGISAAA
jgi:hypothetical protein